jgi:hypothetical protein
MNADKTDNSNTNRFRNKRPVLYFQGNKPTGEPICGDPHAVKQRSASTAEEAASQRYQETTQSGYRKSQRAKQPPRQICRGTREIPKYICRGSQCQLRNKGCIAQAQTAVEANPHNSAGKQSTEGE